MKETTFWTAPEATTSFSMKSTLEKLRGIPPAKWILVAPDGATWSEADPVQLMHILANRVYGIGTPQPAEGA